MNIREIMTQNPACCTPDTGLEDVARLMVECDCGEIPVVADRQRMEPIGVITDRDIVCRVVAEGKNPLELTARDCMTSPAVTVKPEASLEECMTLMEQFQIRRVPVVDERGACCGIVAVADVARRTKTKESGEVVREVSQPSGQPSRAQ